MAVCSVSSDHRDNLTKQIPHSVENVRAMGGQQVAAPVSLDRDLCLISSAVGMESRKQGRLNTRAKITDPVPGVKRADLAKPLVQEPPGVLHARVVPLHRTDLQHQPGLLDKINKLLGFVNR